MTDVSKVDHPNEYLRYAIGDASVPIPNTPVIIAHCCNNVGAWGAGFTRSLEKYPQAEKDYRDWYKGRNLKNIPYPAFRLGQTQMVPIHRDPFLYIANILGQRGIRSEKNPAPIDYQALEEGLGIVQYYARNIKAIVQMPRIGAGLAGGTWDKIEPIIQRVLCDKKVLVVIYDL